MTGFGPNEWLVDELYQAYLADPESVDKAWWDFFADYQPADMTLPRATPAPTEQTVATTDLPDAPTNGAAPETAPAAAAAPADAAPADAAPADAAPAPAVAGPVGSAPPAPKQPQPGAVTPEPTPTAAPTLPHAVAKVPSAGVGGSETSP